MVRMWNSTSADEVAGRDYELLFEIVRLIRKGLQMIIEPSDRIPSARFVL